ncbi:MAG: 8-amino-7-oxononanoate synthase [Frankiaceae bacterium]
MSGPVTAGTADAIAADPLGWLRERAAARVAAGLRRRLRPRRADDDLLDLAGNDYLGLSRHPRVIAAAIEALRTWGAGATGSRLVTGSTALHAELEAALADHCGAEAALVFSSGYLANLGAITALAGAGDLVVSDAANHASVVDACRLSRARVAVVPHGDVDAVERALAGRAERRALVVTDAVFSVDGDRAPLAALAAIARRHGAALVVDEAHAIGVVGDGGEGAVHAAGLAGAPGVVVTATLSKALGSQGGAVIGSRDVIDHLVDSARGFVFDTGLAPAAAGAARAALAVLREQPALAAAVRARAADVAAAVRAHHPGIAEPAAAVVPVPIGDPAAAVAAAASCAAAGVRVGCFRPPSVPDGRSRLRLTARADLTATDLARLRAALAAALPAAGPA